MDITRKMIDLLSPRERLHLALLLGAVLVMAFLEVVSVASVVPFLSVAADPDRIHANAWLSWAYQTLGFSSVTGFLVALAGAALAALVLSNAWMAGTHWAQLRFAHGRSHSLGVQLLRQYLSRPYVFFLRRNSADLSKNMLAETEQVTANFLMPALRLVAQSAVALAIVTLLVVFDPLLALLVAGVLGGVYDIIYLLARRKLLKLGKERLAANTMRYKVAGEAFGAIKDVKLLGKEDAIVAQYVGPSQRFADRRATAAIIGDIPRYALEVLAFGGILVVAVYLILRGEGLQQTIPVLGLYAFAGYRLLPSLQQVFITNTKLRFNAPALDNLHRELTSVPQSLDARASPIIRHSNGSCSRPLRLTRRLELEGVTFTYPGAPKPALRDITLWIEANTTVGIVGPTGSGKTTLVDVVLGLLRAQTGEIRVDGVPLTDANLRAWQDSLGYVPQHIYLTDDTIARNIAFGIPDAQIDRNAVEQAARIANIHGFIMHDLPEGYDTVVGERGIRLSGGQRQRIGIARALYQDPSVLVMDEATSALDTDTETAVMEAIRRLAGTKTMLIIAHRLTTLRGCDALHVLRSGGLVETSTAERVAQTGAVSRQLPEAVI